MRETGVLERRVDGHARVARVAVREQALEAAGVRRRDLRALVHGPALALEELLVVVVDVLLFLMSLVVVGELLEDARRDVERRDEDELGAVRQQEDDDRVDPAVCCESSARSLSFFPVGLRGGRRGFGRSSAYLWYRRAMKRSKSNLG